MIKKEKKKFANKKGVYYTLDAVLASMFLLGAIYLMIENPIKDTSYNQQNYLSQDLLNSLSELKISELNSPVIQAQIADGTLDGNKSIIEQAGEYWAVYDNASAENILKLSFNATILLNNKSLNITIGDGLTSDQLLSSGNSNAGSENQNADVSRRMVAGISKGLPLTGYSSSAVLKKIRNKKTASYAYFGGLVGQGNISFFISDLPSDFTSDKATLIYLEGDFGTNFTFYINDIQCDGGSAGGEFNVTRGAVNITSWNINECNTSLVTGTNTFWINFTGPINASYVAGGFLKIQYRTEEALSNIDLDSKTYNFPTIYGVANLYDSFYIPGQLQTMNVALHFKSSEETYITIGERIITINATGSDQWVYLDNDDLLNTYNFDYDLLSVNTVPLRFAAYNATTTILTSGDADVVLITDLSGSMKKSVVDWTQGHTNGACSTVFTDPDTRRTDVAICVDHEFVDNILNYTGNRIWPVMIYSNDIKYYNNPEDAEAIKGYISSFGQGKGKTCISCAINKAYEILDTYSNESRQKFIVVMTDGVPTHCASGSCTSISEDFGTKYCEGLCDEEGQNCPDIDDSCTECTENDGPVNNTFYSANRSFNDLNTTIYTVGFGPMDDCPLCEFVLNTTAEIGNGTYQQSNDVTGLRDIYRNISLEILNQVTQTSQTVSVADSLVNSNLYGDSHIDFTYEPIEETVLPGKISVTFEEDLPTCTTSVDVPTDIEIIDAVVLSYSDIHWSDVVVTNSITSFNLTDFYVPYYRLGDPFSIQVPVNQTETGTNIIFVETGDSPVNRTGCSPFNKFIYTGLVPSVTSRTDVKDKMIGCNWTVAFEDGETGNIIVPDGYTGEKRCSYTPLNHSASLDAYDPDDTYDIAVFALFNQLDTDDNGRVLININNLDLVIDTTTIGSIPYMWGPSIVTLEIKS